MPEKSQASAVPIPAGRADDLLAIAGRAPSILNTQPWRFRVSRYSIELYCDPSRKLRADTAGREMLISCGAVLFGLRLAIRSLGYQPVVKLLPDPERLRLLAEVRLGSELPMTEQERQMLHALPHRHTHRGAFLPAPLPRGLLIGMQHDAVAEHAELALIDRPGAYEQLATIVASAARGQSLDSPARADARQWVRTAGNAARDGVPASAIAPQSGHHPGLLPQRDLDLGRQIGLLPPGGPPAAATAVLLTPGDTRIDWIRAGQALHRLLARAAISWVFATLNSQPLEAADTRELIRARLTLPGAPQLLMQLGVARIAQATARRPRGDLVERDRSS